MYVADGIFKSKHQTNANRFFRQNVLFRTGIQAVVYGRWKTEYEMGVGEICGTCGRGTLVKKRNFK